MRSIPIKKFSLKGAFGEKGAIVTYKAQIDLHYDDKELTHELYIVKNLPYPLIIGMDFLTRYGAKIKFKVRSHIVFIVCLASSIFWNKIGTLRRDSISMLERCAKMALALTKTRQ